MKKLLLAAALICVSLPALAETTIIRREGDVVTDLPGNAQIVRNPNYDRPGIIITNDDDIWRRMVIGPRTRVYGARPNSAPASAVNSACPSSLNVSDRQKCVHDVIKLQEKYNRRIND